MTYRQQFRSGRHSHRFNLVDADTKDTFCACGKFEKDKEVNKYKARSTQYEGLTYHSAMEAEYAAQLDILVRAKEIVSWERQIKLDLKVNGVHITNYIIDFIVHHHDGSREFTEVKGYATSEWQTKWRILEATFDDFKKHPDDRLTVVKQYATKPNYMRR